MAVLDVYDRSALDVGDGGYFRRSATTPTQDANIDLAATITAGVFFQPQTDRTCTMYYVLRTKCIASVLLWGACSRCKIRQSKKYVVLVCVHVFREFKMLYGEMFPCWGCLRDKSTGEHDRRANPLFARAYCFSDSNGPAGKSLAGNSAIALDGAPPRPVSVSLASGVSDAATYGLGQVIRLAVTFDKSVTVDGDSPPVLVLDCTRAREALFDVVGGGDGSTTLFFDYEVCPVLPSRTQKHPCIDCLLVPGAPCFGSRDEVIKVLKK